MAGFFTFKWFVPLSSYDSSSTCSQQVVRHRRVLPGIRCYDTILDYLPA